MSLRPKAAGALGGDIPREAILNVTSPTIHDAAKFAIEFTQARLQY